MFRIKLTLTPRIQQVYMFGIHLVEAGKVTLLDASDLWGKGIHETLKILRQRHGEDCDAMAIGPAGENLVRFACWVGDFGPGWEYYLDCLVAARADQPLPSFHDYYPAQKAYFAGLAAE